MSIKLKLYLFCVSLVLFVCIQIGWFAPLLLNAADTTLFLLGIVNIIVSLPIIYVWCMKIGNLTKTMFVTVEKKDA